MTMTKSIRNFTDSATASSTGIGADRRINSRIDSPVINSVMRYGVLLYFQNPILFGWKDGLMFASLPVLAETAHTAQDLLSTSGPGLLIQRPVR